MKLLVLIGLNLLIFAGLTSVVYGLWVIYQPLGWVVGGVIAVCLSLFVYGDLRDKL